MQPLDLEQFLCDCHIDKWYWFCHSSFKNGTSSPIVAKLRNIEHVNGTPRYTVYGITDEEYFNICVPFIGELPSFLKEINNATN